VDIYEKEIHLGEIKKPDDAPLYWFKIGNMQFFNSFYLVEGIILCKLLGYKHFNLRTIMIFYSG
jgi:hypothetical protein